MNEHDLVEGLPEITKDVLVAVFEEGGEASLSRVEEVTGDPMTAAEQGDLLRAKDLADSDDEAPLSSGVTLTPLGIRAAKAVVESRTTGNDRVEAVRRGLLQWLNANRECERVSEFIGHDSATSYGRPFTMEEVEDETEYLLENVLIEGKAPPRRSSMKAPSRDLKDPRLTSRGREALMSRRPISDFVAGRPPSQSFDYSTTYKDSAHVEGSTFSGSSLAGQGNTVINNGPVTIDQRREILSTIDSALTSLAEEGMDASEAREAMTDLREAAADESIPRSTLQEKFLTTTVASATSTVTQKFLESLPLLAAALWPLGS